MCLRRVAPAARRTVRKGEARYRVGCGADEFDVVLSLSVVTIGQEPCLMLRGGFICHLSAEIYGVITAIITGKELGSHGELSRMWMRSEGATTTALKQELPKTTARLHTYR
eukprot:2995101-Amphidinium_carterae.1